MDSSASDETTSEAPISSDAVYSMLLLAPRILVIAHVVSWACGIAVIWFHRDLGQPGFAATVNNAELFLSRVNHSMYEHAYRQVEWLSYYWTKRQDLEMSLGSGAWWYLAWVLLVAGAVKWYFLALLVRIAGWMSFPRIGMALLLFACGWILRAWFLWFMGA